MWGGSTKSLRHGEMADWHKDYMDFMFAVNDVNRKYNSTQSKLVFIVFS